MKNEYIEIPCNKRLIKEIAEELTLTEGKVTEIIQSYTDFIGQTMMEGTMNGVMIPYLGKFKVSIYRQQMISFLGSMPEEMRKLWVSSLTAQQRRALYKDLSNIEEEPDETEDDE